MSSARGVRRLVASGASRFPRRRSLASALPREAEVAESAPLREITVTRVSPAVAAEAEAPLKEYESLAEDARVRALVASKYAPRTDWTREEIRAVYEAPLLELIRDAAAVHRAHWDSRDVQQCTLLSIKTGGCTEDCGYCAQSVRHKTHVKPTRPKRRRKRRPTRDVKRCQTADS